MVLYKLSHVRVVSSHANRDRRHLQPNTPNAGSGRPHRSFAPVAGFRFQPDDHERPVEPKPPLPRVESGSSSTHTGEIVGSATITN